MCFLEGLTLFQEKAFHMFLESLLNIEGDNVGVVMVIKKELGSFYISDSFIYPMFINCYFFAHKGLPLSQGSP